MMNDDGDSHDDLDVEGVADAQAATNRRGKACPR